MSIGFRVALACCLAGVGGCALPTDADRGALPGDGDTTVAADAAFLTSVEDELLGHIDDERSRYGLPRLVRDPGIDTVMQWHVSNLAAEHRLGHEDADGRLAEERARYYGDDSQIRCTEIIQWWGGAPSGAAHYQGYYDSPEHHEAYMERGIYDLGATMHAGVGALAGTGPTGTPYEARSGSYSGVMLCDAPIALAIDPFAAP